MVHRIRDPSRLQGPATGMLRLRSHGNFFRLGRVCDSKFNGRDSQIAEGPFVWTNQKRIVCAFIRYPLSTVYCMWCPNCNSTSPLVSLQHQGLYCARCDVEVVLEKPATIEQNRKATRTRRDAENGNQETARNLSPQSVFATDKESTAQRDRGVARNAKGSSKENADLPGVSGRELSPQAHLQLFRFDAGHVDTRLRDHERERAVDLKDTEASRPQQRHTAIEHADSPKTTMSIGLFFAGQSLVVWAFFMGNVLGLAAGMVIAISAVGVGYLGLAPKSTPPTGGQESPAAKSGTPTIKKPKHKMVSSRRKRSASSVLNQV